MTVEDLKTKLDNDDVIILVIDVREPHEWSEFNIGGMHIPLGTIPTKIDDIKELAKGVDEVAMLCRSGNRSGQATHFLNSVGVENVVNVEGGLLAWTEFFGKE